MPWVWHLELAPPECQLFLLGFFSTQYAGLFIPERMDQILSHGRGDLDAVGKRIHDICSLCSLGCASSELDPRQGKWLVQRVGEQDPGPSPQLGQECVM